MNILITGSAGFIGRHLVKALVKEGHHCRCLVRKASNIEELKKLENIEFVYGDIRNRESLRGVVKDMDIVYHLAAIGHVSSVSNKTYEMYRVNNLQGTKNLVEECLEIPIKRFIYFSSTAAMGLLKLPIVDESAVCCPKTLHQTSKHDCEELLMKYWYEFKFPVIIMRPCMVYGHTAKGEFYKMTRLIDKGIFPRVGKGKNLTPIVHVDDVVQAVILAMNKSRLGEAYIIASEKSYELSKLWNITVDSLEDKRTYFYIPTTVAKLVAFVCELIAKTYGGIPLVNRRNIESTVTDRVFSIEKAKKELGYTPKVNLEEGIKQTVKWYKENGYL